MGIETSFIHINQRFLNPNILCSSASFSKKTSLFRGHRSFFYNANTLQRIRYAATADAMVSTPCPCYPNPRRIPTPRASPPHSFLTLPVTPAGDASPVTSFRTKQQAAHIPAHRLNPPPPHEVMELSQQAGVPGRSFYQYPR